MPVERIRDALLTRTELNFIKTPLTDVVDYLKDRHKIEIQIDGQTRALADLSTVGARQAQQTVFETSGLAPGKHAIKIVNRGPGPVAVDAMAAR